MSKLKVVDLKGSPSGEVEVADALLDAGKGASAVHDAVVNYLAGVRAGSASTRTKAEVSGSNRKMWRQKGTGRARAHYRRSPVWRGGGVAFGPKPRDYGKKMNRKVAQLAFRTAVSDKIAAGEIVVIEALEMEEAKTKQFAQILKSLEIKGNALFVAANVDDKVKLSARNLPNVELVRAQDVDVFRLVKYNTVVVTKDGLDVMIKRLEGSKEAKK